MKQLCRKSKGLFEKILKIIEIKSERIYYFSIFFRNNLDISSFPSHNYSGTPNRRNPSKKGISMFRPLDLVAIFLFLGAMAAMGIYFSRRNTSTEEYFLGNRAFPGWAVGISMLGTSISSVTFLAIPAAAYILDYRQAVSNLALPVAAVLAVAFFIPLFRRGRITSAFEYLEARYGIAMRSYAALSFVILQLIRLASVLFLVSIPVASMFGCHIVWVILIGGLVVGAYTVLGGIEAVIWTDVVQTVILLAGGLLCIGMILFLLPGGVGQVLEIGREFDKFSPGPISFRLDDRTFFVVLLLGVVNFTTEYAGNQNVVQRYVAARSTREARKATLLCMCMSVPTWMSFFFLGSCLFAYYHVFPSAEVAALEADQVLPYFILHKTPPFVGGVIISACLAAAMSSLDSSINAISTVVTIDFVKRFGRPRSDAQYLKIAKGIACAAGLFMILGAIGINYIPKESMNDFGLIVGSMFGGGMLAVFLLGFFSTRVGNRAILTATAAALLCNLVLMFNTFYGFLPIHPYWTTIAVNGVLWPVGYLLGFLWPNRRDLSGLTVWTGQPPA